MLAATVLALGLFVGIELYMESITINSSVTKPAVDWQLALCIDSPDAVQAFQGLYNDTFKIHYFLVAAVIITLVISVAYGYGKMLSGRSRSKRIPLRLQLAATVLLLGLCVFANFTGFFRDAKQYQTFFPSLLTGTFFVVLGASLGVYTGSHLIRQRQGAVHLAARALAAILVCSVMYYGEYHLLGGTLYRFGSVLLF